MIHPKSRSYKLQADMKLGEYKYPEFSGCKKWRLQLTVKGS